MRKRFGRVALVVAGTLAAGLVTVPVASPAQAVPMGAFVQRSGSTLVASAVGAPTQVVTSRTSAVAARPATVVVRTVVRAVSLSIKTRTVATGQKFTLSGRVSPAKSGVIVKRQRVLNGTWVTLGQTRTTSGGYWKMSVTAPATEQTITYRAIAPASSGSVRSTKITVQVKAAPKPVYVSSLTLASSLAEVPGGEALSFTGLVAPAKAGAVVRRQQFVDGAWKTIDQATTDATGQFTFTTTAPATQQVATFRAIAAATSSTWAVSNELAITVLEPLIPPIDALGLGGRILGTDISRWQHAMTSTSPGLPIDFATMYTAGARFVFIKASDGDAIEGNGSGHRNAAVWYSVDRTSAQAAGLYTGFYHFAQIPSSNTASVLQASALNQAALAIDRLANAGGYGPKDLPYVLDIEVAPSGVTKSSITLFARTFLDEMERRTGRRPIVYASPSYLQDKVTRDDFWRTSPLWIAHYMSDAEVLTRQPGSKTTGGCYFTAWTRTDCTMDWTFWQYTSKGPAQSFGIPSGAVSGLDMNLFNGTAAQFISLTRGTWTPATSDFLPTNEPTTFTTSVVRTAANQWTITATVTRVPTGTPVIAGTVAATLAAVPVVVTDPLNPPPTPRILSRTKTADGTWTIVVADLATTPMADGVNTLTLSFTDAAAIHAAATATVTILN